MSESDDRPDTHQTCPECGHHGCYTTWKDGGAFCHSCGFRKGGKDHTSSGVPGLWYDPDVHRSEPAAHGKITRETTLRYSVKSGYNDKGVAVRREYPYPSQVKYRYLPKDFSKNYGFKSNELFGMNHFAAGSSKIVTITEGEEDCLAAYQMLNGKEVVVSLPTSSISSALIENCDSWLRSFDKIVVCTDNDSAGRKAAERLATAYPNRVFLVDLSAEGLNDPRDYLEGGKDREFFNAWKNAKKFVPSGFFNTPDQMVDILSTNTELTFYPTPINALNDVIYGLPLGHLVVLTGPEGQGKTEILRLFEHHMIKEHPDVNIGVLHMEETKKTCLETYACYELGTNVRRPDHTVSRKDINSSIRNLTKAHNLYMFDFHIDEDPLSILEKVRYLHTACDCQMVFIDPIQQLAYGNRADKSEEQVLSQIAVQLERLANDLDICIVMTTHVNDDGQTRSSRMIGKSASVRIDLTRDHMATDPDVRNTTFLSVSKNRPVGQTGFGGCIKFDPDTFTLEEENVA